jgi:hypothetical protein
LLVLATLFALAASSISTSDIDEIVAVLRTGNAYRPVLSQDWRILIQADGARGGRRACAEFARNMKLKATAMP